MKLSGEQILPAPRQQVRDLFNDPQHLSRLIPGCEKLEQLPVEFAGTVNVGIAAVKGVYTGKLKLDEIRAPEHYKMIVDGKGKQGFMRGSGVLDLAPEDGDSGQTVVKYAGDIQIGGPLVQVGRRVIESAAKDDDGAIPRRGGSRAEGAGGRHRGASRLLHQLLALLHPSAPIDVQPRLGRRAVAARAALHRRRFAGKSPATSASLRSRLVF
jgi:carbon monoxide dehydrogenase subunit G